MKSISDRLTASTHGLNQPFKSDFAHEVLGIPGRMTHPTVKPGRPLHLFFNQKWVSEWRTYDGGKSRLRAEIRFDDSCGNGSNSFAITANGERFECGRWRDDICGCCHKEIARVFPALKGLIQWHLCSTDGPMHYEANTVYLASDRDHYGLLKGERRQIKNGRTGTPAWRLAYVDAQGREVTKPEQYADADAAPACDVRLAYLPWERIGEGKARELDAARDAAIWPDATDAELCAPADDLRTTLRARLPALLAAFRADVERAGFLWLAHSIGSDDGLNLSKVKT